MARWSAAGVGGESLGAWRGLSGALTALSTSEVRWSQRKSTENDGMVRTAMLLQGVCISFLYKGVKGNMQGQRIVEIRERIDIEV